MYKNRTLVRGDNLVVLDLTACDVLYQIMTKTTINGVDDEH